ncbi:hypothetical protein H4696_002873 [Amycolatopsis lexingtonensis]|uniref:YwiC-like protein n=1 Tax=Amycolatopsis lexingtonensis TaxID=218822 RepID=A0ABR9HXZ4_9PSEU|nr:YwiC-like family protein [Amycolatopsis lexingtonensis]MBE1495773.1 hypothetical protein [Amycolatopsis lexingtonensis]
MSTRTPARRRDPVLPGQHGAWGFLALPLLLGIAATGWSFWLVPLAVAWVAAYPCSWALTGLLTARRPERFRKAARLWTPICVAAGVPLLVTHLWLGGVLVAYLLLFVVNLRLARARRERSLANGLVLIAECVLLVPVVAGVVDGEIGTLPVLTAAVLTALALVGSTLHVKSLIRERANPAYTRASRAFALASPVVVYLVSGHGWLVVPFVLLAVRAFWWHDPSWRPARIGLVELGGLVCVAAAAFPVL